MMEILLIVIFTIVTYTAVLSRKTVLSFKKTKIKISYLFGFLLTMYIFYVHIKIALENIKKPKFIFFVFKQYFLRFDLPLTMLVEVVKENMTSQKTSVSAENNESVIGKWFKSRNARNEYSDILEDQCFA